MFIENPPQIKTKGRKKNSRNKSLLEKVREASEKKEKKAKSKLKKPEKTKEQGKETFGYSNILKKKLKYF